MDRENKRLVGIMKEEDYIPFKMAQLENLQHERIFGNVVKKKLDVDLIAAYTEDSFEERKKRFFKDNRYAVSMDAAHGTEVEAVDLSDLWKVTGLVKKNKLIVVSKLDSKVNSIEKTKELISKKTNISISELDNYYILIGEEKTASLIGGWIRDAKLDEFSDFQLVKYYL